MIRAIISWTITLIIIWVVGGWFLHHGGEAGSFVHQAIDSAKDFLNRALGS